MFQELLALVMRLPETWSRKAMVGLFGTHGLCMSTTPAMSSLTGRPVEKREAHSSSDAFEAGQRPFATLCDGLRFSGMPAKKGTVRGSISTVNTDSRDCAGKHCNRGSHCHTVLRMVKSLGLAGARECARRMISVLVNNLVVCDVLPFLNLSLPDDELNEQVALFVCAKNIFLGSPTGVVASQLTKRVLAMAAENLNEGLLPPGFSFDKTTAEHVQTGPDDEKLGGPRGCPERRRSPRCPQIPCGQRWASSRPGRSRRPPTLRRHPPQRVQSACLISSQHQCRRTHRSSLRSGRTGRAGTFGVVLPSQRPPPPPPPPPLLLLLLPGALRLPVQQRAPSKTSSRQR